MNKIKVIKYPVSHKSADCWSKMLFHVDLMLYLCLVSPVVPRPEGKGSRQFVFSLIPVASPRTGPVLDIAASSIEELKDWMMKIREVTMTSEAKVRPTIRALSPPPPPVIQ